MKSKLVAFGIVCVSALIGCGSGGERVAGPGGIPIPGQDSSGNPNPPLARDTTGVPLSDLGAMNYKGFAGGLYPDRAAVMSADHASVGTARGRGIVPLDVNGTPKSNGKIVFLSIGMSNTADEFCGGDKTTGCDATTFIPIAAADGSVNHSTRVIVNGSRRTRGRQQRCPPPTLMLTAWKPSSAASFALSRLAIQISSRFLFQVGPTGDTLPVTSIPSRMPMRPALP